MGLDMYLSKKTYVKNWSHQAPGERHTISIKKGTKKRTDIIPERISNIEEEVMYWRKANAIHNWFVQNVQEGNDNCGTYYVDCDKLSELVDLCKKAVAVIDKADIMVKEVHSGWSGGQDTFLAKNVYDCSDEIEDILPPTSGFFFGSTEIDDYYKDDLVNTIEVLEKELSSSGSGDYYYSSSW